MNFVTCYSKIVYNPLMEQTKCQEWSKQNAFNFACKLGISPSFPECIKSSQYSVVLNLNMQVYIMRISEGPYTGIFSVKMQNYRFLIEQPWMRVSCRKSGCGQNC
ncbi:hypothetical protein KSP39_PZI019222 [Platanthera zijinensis]|uniref:Uncharacterized protein n=1 Tax=Platanthera zijinensis TaxID=2320716 RepID=A0AAP0B191_9ASPA